MKDKKDRMVEALRWTGYFSFKPLPEWASRGRKSCKEKQQYINSGSCRERGEWWKSICGGGRHQGRRFQSSQFLRISLPGHCCISKCLLSRAILFHIWSRIWTNSEVGWIGRDNTTESKCHFLNKTVPKRFLVDQRITDLYEGSTAEEKWFIGRFKTSSSPTSKCLIIDFDHLDSTASYSLFTLHEMLLFVSWLTGLF